MVGKPNQTIPKAHLQPILAFDESFSRIIIYYVGPLPKTKSGHEYFLTILYVLPRASQKPFHLGILKLITLLRQVYKVGLEFEVWILVFDLFRSSKV